MSQETGWILIYPRNITSYNYATNKYCSDPGIKLIIPAHPCAFLHFYSASSMKVTKLSYSIVTATIKAVRGTGQISKVFPREAV